MNFKNKKHVILCQNNRAFTLLCIALLTTSACTASKPFLIELPDGFESSAQSIHVKTPRMQFKNNHFDVALGEYQIVNSKVESFVSDGNQFSLSLDKKTENLLTHLLDGRLLPDVTKRESIGKASSRDYRFDVAIDNITRVESDCSLTKSVEVVVEEKSTQSILGSSSKNSSTQYKKEIGWMKSSPRSNEKGELLQTLYSCNLNSGNTTAKLSVIENRGKKPVYVFESSAHPYRFAPMYNIASPHYRKYENVPTVSDQNTDIEDAPAKLSGVTLLRGSQPVAIVSLVDFNNKIWLANDLDTEEAEWLLGIGYTLILSSWLDD